MPFFTDRLRRSVAAGSDLPKLLWIQGSEKVMTPKLLMEEFLHHLGCIKPLLNNGRNYQHINWWMPDFSHQQYLQMLSFHSLPNSCFRFSCLPRFRAKICRKPAPSPFKVKMSCWTSSGAVAKGPRGGFWPYWGHNLPPLRWCFTRQVRFGKDFQKGYTLPPINMVKSGELSLNERKIKLEIHPCSNEPWLWEECLFLKGEGVRPGIVFQPEFFFQGLYIYVKLWKGYIYVLYHMVIFCYISYGFRKPLKLHGSCPNSPGKPIQRVNVESRMHGVRPLVSVFGWFESWKRCLVVT